MWGSGAGGSPAVPHDVPAWPCGVAATCRPSFPKPLRKQGQWQRWEVSVSPCVPGVALGCPCHWVSREAGASCAGLALTEAHSSTKECPNENKTDTKPVILVCEALCACPRLLVSSLLPLFCFLLKSPLISLWSWKTRNQACSRPRGPPGRLLRVARGSAVALQARSWSSWRAQLTWRPCGEAFHRRPGRRGLLLPSCLISPSGLSSEYLFSHVGPFEVYLGALGFFPNRRFAPS